MAKIKRFGVLERKYLMQVLDSEMLGDGRSGSVMVNSLEREFAKKMEVKYAIAVNSGMSGLHCAVAAADVGPGDEVICDPIVHFAASAVMYHNAVPVFADVKEDTFLIDPESIEERISNYTKAIICTHLFGLPCDMDPIMKIAKEYGLTVIEDVAQAIGARYKGRYTGSLGDMGVFSFQQSKHITSGDGGMVTTDSSELADKVRVMRILGYKPEALSVLSERWKEGRLGWNYRMTELQAAVLRGQLTRLDEIVELHVNVAKMYDEVLDGCSWLRPQKVENGVFHSYWQYAVLFDGTDKEYERFKRVMKEEGCKASYGYTQRPATLIPLITEIRAYGKGCPIKCPHYKGKAKYGEGVVPVAERILPRIVLLEMAWLDQEEARRNADALERVISKF
ncbi:DegT/DnrJ/EryC1/StrS family aminotransferase [Candidatus Bathyarchaeota archaeon]|nr:MAG: DegT/DnrJ/EryC1/StrS family aminotransferase [Candidatus Bathyarchaeota archaeon]